MRVGSSKTAMFGSSDLPNFHIQGQNYYLAVMQYVVLHWLYTNMEIDDLDALIELS